MRESARYILQILVFVGLILSIGTFGYLMLEDGMTVGDAFYMTVTAITPTQFDEVHELTTAGRYFTVVLVFCGFGAVVAFATQFARLVIQSELEGVGVITRKHMRRRISQMKNHYIVCGYGEIGGAICSELRDQQLPFVVVTNDEASLEAIDREGHARVKGNPTADSSLKEAEIERAAGVIAVLADDSDNLFISLAARELNPQILIIARGEEASVEDRILRAGADIVVSPMQLGGRQIAALIKQQASDDAVMSAGVHSKTMGWSLETYHHRQDDPIAVGDLIRHLNACGAAGLTRADGSFESTPSAETMVQSGDAVAIIHHEDRPEHSAGVVKRRTILLADDHRALRLLFTRKLAAGGHNVIQAADGEEALNVAQAKNPDLIVLDVNMPRRNGYEVCSALRRQSLFAEIPIILYSGDKTPEFVRRGREAGADICIRKTSKSSELLASIDNAFAARADSARGVEPTSTPSSASTVFDLDVAMETVDGNRELLAEMAAAMISETPRLMTQMEQAIEEKDRESLQRAAHTVYGSVAILGAKRAAEAASSLEAIDSDVDWQEIGSRHRALHDHLMQLMSELHQFAAPSQATP